MLKRILFVDDERNVLDGFKRLLRSSFRPGEWEMCFAISAAEGLQMLAANPFDVVVSDMRMPVMDGAEFLGLVQQSYPDTVRIILSGHSDREMILRSIGSTHQFLTKPCDSIELVTTILRAVAMRQILKRKNILSLVSQIKTLPALPDIYHKVTTELRKPEPSVAVVGELISQDMAISAKVLQLVNSAFFGLSRKVESPAHAVSLLGLDIINSLVLMVQVFTQLPPTPGLQHVADWLWQHSLQVARVSQAIAHAHLPGNKKAADDAFMAGLFHDLGQLVLMANLPGEYGRIVELMETQQMSVIAAEHEVLEASHAETGAYLLGLWGFPDAMVEVALYHHAPAQCQVTGYSALAAVHLADVWVSRDTPMILAPGAVVLDTPLDMEFIQHTTLATTLPELELVCAAALKHSPPA